MGSFMCLCGFNLLKSECHKKNIVVVLFVKVEEITNKKQKQL